MMNTKRHSEFIRPGPGWIHLGGPVWEHRRGIRAHVGGMCGFPVEPIVDGTLWPESLRLDRCVAMCGGNRTRGGLTWALIVFEEFTGRYSARVQP